MVKIVRYNGETKSHFGCSEPTALIVGKEYEVKSKVDSGSQVDYELKGVRGYFDSTWFDEINLPQDTFMALAHNVPVAGEKWQCHKLEPFNGRFKISKCTTSTVRDVFRIGTNIYRVTTCDNAYIVQIA